MTSGQFNAGTDEATVRPATPAIWLPVGPAISWVAFGVAEELWSDRFYFGASAWTFLTPADVVAWLDEVAKYGAAEQASIVDYEIDLMPVVYRRAEVLSPTRIADDRSARIAIPRADPCQ